MNNNVDAVSQYTDGFLREYMWHVKYEIKFIEVGSLSSSLQSLWFANTDN